MSDKAVPLTELQVRNTYQNIDAILGGIQALVPNTAPVIRDRLERLIADHLLARSEVEQLRSDLAATEAEGVRLAHANQRLSDQLAQERQINSQARQQIELLNERLENDGIEAQQAFIDQDMRTRLLELMAETEAMADHLRTEIEKVTR